MAVIGIDWDNTLVDVDQKLLPGAKEAISQLREAGHKVVINSCNNPDWIQKCLNEWGIPVDAVWNGKRKLNADIFIDDKAYKVPYNPDWRLHIDDIMITLKNKDNRKW